MHFLKQRLENEKDLYAKRLAEGRTDLMAKMLLSRIEHEIKRIEDHIDAKTKNEPTRERTSGAIYYAKGVVQRYWDVCNSGYRSILRILAGPTPRKEEAVK